MNWIGILLLIIHVATCAALILIVLLQAGKGASLGAAFGGGASQTVFGARSATLIGRATWVLAGIFLLTSLLLTVISPWGGKGGVEAGSSILHEEPIATPPLGEPAQSELPAAGSTTGETSETTGQVPLETTPTESAAPTEPTGSQAQPESAMPEPPTASHPQTGPETPQSTPASQ